MVSIEDPNKDEKKDKLCPSCGITGRHPKASNCPMKKGKKKN